MTQHNPSVLNEFGWWCPESPPESMTPERLKTLLYNIVQPVVIVDYNGAPHLVTGPGKPCPDKNHDAALPICAVANSHPLEYAGDPSFKNDWNLTYPVVGGSMANGISSVDLVAALAGAGMTGFYGAAGQSLSDVEAAVIQLQERCGDTTWGVNLIHSPQEPALEEHLVDLLLKHGVRRIEASAYMNLTRALVRFRLHGIHRDASGRIVAPHTILAKASRVEVAEKFFSPPPDAILQSLVADGIVTPEQAELGRHIPVAADITAEADSGGHTDNRPLVTLLPSFLSLSRSLQETYGYDTPLRVGAAGGISTPGSVAAAFAMGAGWILVGSIAQSAVESGSSDPVREMLAEVRQAEIAMAPAADMFEMGVNVQVLKRGTLFPMRARKLYDLYREYDGIEALPPKDRQMLERTVFRMPVDQVWEVTRRFWSARDPAQIQRAETDPKHRMALIFRWYLGLSSRWANAGIPDRKPDYQVWCGPGMGAFNQWVRGTFLEAPAERRIVTMVLNILWGSAVICRALQIRSRGIALPQSLLDIRPQPLERVYQYIGRERKEP